MPLPVARDIARDAVAHAVVLAVGELPDLQLVVLELRAELFGVLLEEFDRHALDVCRPYPSHAIDFRYALRGQLG